MAVLVHVLQVVVAAIQHECLAEQTGFMQPSANEGSRGRKKTKNMELLNTIRHECLSQQVQVKPSAREGIRG